MCCHLVSNHLTDDQKQTRLEASQVLVKMADAIPNFLNPTFIENASWRLRCDPKRNGEARNVVLLHHLFGKRSEQRNHASE